MGERLRRKMRSLSIELNVKRCVTMRDFYTQSSRNVDVFSNPSGIWSLHSTARTCGLSQVSSLQQREQVSHCIKMASSIRNLFAHTRPLFTQCKWVHSSGISYSLLLSNRSHSYNWRKRVAEREL